MSPAATGVLGVAALFLLLFLRLPVWAALVLVGFGGNSVLADWSSAFSTLGQAPFDTASLYTLSVVPLFILTGGVASGTGLSADLFKAATVTLSGLRGGLAVATIGASACFGAVCGSSIATVATMTPISLKEMRQARYSDGLATGAIAAGGTLGILFPPSIILVIYGAIAQQSVPKLFAAGLVPGILLTLLYMAAALTVARIWPDEAPSAPSATMRARVVALRGPWQFLTLFVVTIGGIYAGVFSPTEAASIGALGAILLGLLGRRLKLSALVTTIESAVVTSCMLYVIIIAANLFAYFMVQTQLPTALAEGTRARARRAGLGGDAPRHPRLPPHGMLSRGDRHDPHQRAGLPAARRVYRIRSDVVRHHRRHRRRGRPHPPARGHEPLRHPGAGAGRVDARALPRRASVPPRALRAHRASFRLPAARALATPAPLWMSPS